MKTLHQLPAALHPCVCTGVNNELVARELQPPSTHKCYNKLRNFVHSSELKVGDFLTAFNPTATKLMPSLKIKEQELFVQRF